MLDDGTPSGDGQDPRPPLLIPSSFQRHPKALDCFSDSSGEKSCKIHRSFGSTCCISVSQIVRSNKWLTLSISRGQVLGPM